MKDMDRYTYSQIVQATGRVSRGERTADGGFLENHAALADGMATTKKAIGYYSNYFVEAMRKA